MEEQIIKAVKRSDKKTLKELFSEGFKKIDELTNIHGTELIVLMKRV